LQIQFLRQQTSIKLENDGKSWDSRLPGSGEGGKLPHFLDIHIISPTEQSEGKKSEHQLPAGARESGRET
jgi:hypothetical protein